MKRSLFILKSLIRTDSWNEHLIQSFSLLSVFYKVVSVKNTRECAEAINWLIDELIKLISFSLNLWSNNETTCGSSF